MNFLLLAESVEAMTWVDPVVRLVTAGGFGALVWYFIVKHNPAMEERHRGERKVFIDYIRERDSKLEEIVREYYVTLEGVRTELRDVKSAVERKTN